MFAPYMIKNTFIRVNHYIGSWEYYSFRTNIYGKEAARIGYMGKGLGWSGGKSRDGLD
jgi:hypothetical protein